MTYILSVVAGGFGNWCTVAQTEREARERCAAAGKDFPKPLYRVVVRKKPAIYQKQNFGPELT